MVGFRNIVKIKGYNGHGTICVTIPKHVAQALMLKSGCRVEFTDWNTKNRSVTIRVVPSEFKESL